MAPLADAEARRRIREDLDQSFVVEAAAGTGKTTQLVERIATLVQSGRTDLSRVVALTFTEKAAGEMKLRLRAELERRRHSEARTRTEREQLELALAQLETAHIATIHAFCADLLRERPIEAAVDPDFQVIDAEASQQHLEQVFTAWFEQSLAEPPEGLRRILRRRPWRQDESPRDLVLSAAGTLVEHRDFAADWAVPELEREAELWALFSRLHALSQLSHDAFNPGDWLVKGLTELGDRLERAAPAWAKQLAEAPGTGPGDAISNTSSPGDFDAVEAAFADLPNARFRGGNKPIWLYRGGNNQIAPGVTFESTREQLAELRLELVQLNQRLDADLAAQLQRALRPVVAEYALRLNSAGVLDFLDLLRGVRDLLVNQPAVRHELQRRFSHLFVDEFQDTDPLQAEILLLLASSEPDQVDSTRAKPVPGKLFVVGDPKQAIYRFRRADVLLYERVKQQLLAQGAELLQLSTSFRSTPAIQSMVNHCFAAHMDGSGSQPSYVPLTRFRTEPETQPSLVVLPVPTPYPSWARDGRPTLSQVGQSFPDAVAAFIDWLVHESGWETTDASGPRPIAVRDVCCLFRRFQGFGEDVTRPYVRALEARRLAHVLVGGRSFHGREEVMALRAALAAIEWPDEELNVYASLRGPLFALSDSELLEFKYFIRPASAAHGHRLGKLHPLRPLDRARMPESISAVADALDLLGRLHIKRNRRPIAETLNELLAATRAHAGIAIWPTGEQALANVLRMVDQARRYEARGALSFRGFVEWLDTQAERGLGSEATVVEEGTGGVRIMTVHAAKGLEFPVVLLCDPGAQLLATRPSRYIDASRGLWAQALCSLVPQDLLEHEAEVRAQDDAEIVRLAYVAATRARDLLVLPGVGDGPFPNVERWTSVFHPGIYPLPAERASSAPAPGCPEFGDDSVVSRPFDESPYTPVRPGLHHALGGGAGCVWWDPRVLRLGEAERGGLRQQELLTPGARSEAIELAHTAWKQQRQTDITRAAQPVSASHSVTQIAHGYSGEDERHAVGQAPSPAPSDAPSSIRIAAQSQIPSNAAPLPDGPPEWLVRRSELIRVEPPLYKQASRPRGARFGTLVHALLERAELSPKVEADPELTRRLADLLGRQLGASDAEVLAAVNACGAALQHPILQRAQRSLELRRECALSFRTPAGQLWEGIVDMAFREAEGWVVVDFKTDVERDAPLAYRLQAAIYCEALERATGLPCQGVLLGV